MKIILVMIVLAGGYPRYTTIGEFPSRTACAAAAEELITSTPVTGKKIDVTFACIGGQK